jgi:cytochrome P450
MSWPALTVASPAASSVLAVAAACIGYQILKALYNISPLHPLSKVPGPKWAAMSYLPEFYYDVVLKGRYTHTIKQMHDKYGPIVRINPNETHCNDVVFADEIYAVGGRKRDKPVHQVNSSISIAASGFATRDHDMHRTRRVPVAKFFSHSMVDKLERDIHPFVDKLCTKILAESGKQPIDITAAYSCFTADMIFDYCFGKPLGLLDQNGWHPNFRQATLAALKPGFVLRFFPFLAGFFDLAELIVDYLPEDTALFVRTLRVTIPNHLSKTKADLDNGVHFTRPTVFGSLLDSDLSEKEKTKERLVGEAYAVVGAGTETTSWALGVITYHLLDKPELLEKLRTELLNHIPDSDKLPSWAALEKLPYLGAVIMEGLRLSYGVSGRTAREPVGEDLHYEGEFNKKPFHLTLPRGYAIGMSAGISHHDKDVFPDSGAFIPERWLDSENRRRKDLERGFFAFSRGSRGCLGKNLAMCELHLSLAALALRVIPRMQLYETTLSDVEYDYDMFVPMAKAGNKGVRVTIT